MQPFWFLPVLRPRDSTSCIAFLIPPCSGEPTKRLHKPYQLRFPIVGRKQKGSNFLIQKRGNIFSHSVFYYFLANTNLFTQFGN